MNLPSSDGASSPSLSPNFTVVQYIESAVDHARMRAVFDGDAMWSSYRLLQVPHVIFDI